MQSGLRYHDENDEAEEDHRRLVRRQYYVVIRVTMMHQVHFVRLGVIDSPMSISCPVTTPMRLTVLVVRRVLPSPGDFKDRKHHWKPPPNCSLR